MSAIRFKLAFLIFSLFLLGACTEVGDPLVTPSGEIQGIFDENGCSGCHGGNGGLTLSEFEEKIPEGNNGPVVIPCDADNSILIQKVCPQCTEDGEVPFGGQMPLGSDPMSDRHVQALRNWINAGLPGTPMETTCN